MCHPVKLSAVYDCSAKCSPVSVHIFCGAVCHDVGAPFKRTTVDWCGESVVDDEGHTVFVSYACKLLNVEHGTSGVTYSLAKHHLCVRTESLLDLLLRVVGINEGAVDTQLLESDPKQVECAAINLVACHNMVTSLADVKHGIEVGSLTAARQHSSHTSFKLRNLLCHNIIGWVLQTSVEIALLLQVEEHGHLL